MGHRNKENTQMTQTTQTTLQTYEAVIWEKAEHWTFDTTIKASSEQEAWKLLAKDYPKRSYSVRSLQPVWAR